MTGILQIRLHRKFIVIKNGKLKFFATVTDATNEMSGFHDDEYRPCLSRTGTFFHCSQLDNPSFE